MGMSFLKAKIHSNSSHKTKKITDILRMRSPNKKINKNCSFQSKFIRLLKRMSSCFFKGAVSVEAAIAIPLFIFFMANLMMIIVAFGRYSAELSKAQQIARGQALLSNDINSFGDQIVTFELAVPINPLVKSVSYNSSFTVACMKYRKWTGYDVLAGNDTSKEEEYVYITEYGNVYHRNRGCNHLNITVNVVACEEINSKRNNSKEKYKPCELCGGKGTGLLFITPEGNKYHCSADCSGLKRTVKTVRLSEVGGRGPCSECGY